MLYSVKPASLASQTAVNTELSLWFSTRDRMELTRTSFRSPYIPDEIVAVRGKTGGAYRTSITFQWTCAVQAVCILLLRTVARCKLGHQSAPPLLHGGKGSLAASLDSSISKQTAWQDLFGATAGGEPLIRRIISRSNAGLRRAGPVVLSLNERILPPSAIKGYIDDRLLTNPHEIQERADAIETAWNMEHFPIAVIPRPMLDHPLRL